MFPLDIILFNFIQIRYLLLIISYYMRQIEEEEIQKELINQQEIKNPISNVNKQLQQSTHNHVKDYIHSFLQFASENESNSQHYSQIEPVLSQSKRSYIRKFSKGNKNSLKKNNQMEEMKTLQIYKNQRTQYFMDEEAQKLQQQVYINNLKIYFPYKLYDIQKQYISKVVEAINQSQNALLESPTGTGKTLCLLSACLSWIWAEKNQGRHRRVIYLSRTHSQLQQVQKQIKATCFRPTIAIVGSRDHLCLKEQLFSLKGRQKVQACSKGVKLKLKWMSDKSSFEKLQGKEKQQTMNSICKYYIQKPESVQLGMNHFSNKLYTMSEFKQQAQNMKFCPYYYPFYMDQYADMFIMPYNYILDPDLLPRYANMLTNSILIFDEAHNVAEASCEGRSYQFLSTNIKGAHAEIQKLQFSPRPSASLLLIRNSHKNEINDIFSSLQDLNASVCEFVNLIGQQEINENKKMYSGQQSKIKIKVIDRKQIQLALYQLFNGKILYNNLKQSFQAKEEYFKTQIHQIVTKIHRFSSKAEDLIEQLKQTEDGIFHNLQKLSTFWNKVGSLLSKSVNCGQKFIDNEINHFRLVIKMQINEELTTLNGRVSVQSFEIQLRCLVPWLTFSDIMAYSPKCVLFTSGTMSPLDAWQNELRIEAKVKLSNNHIIKKTQIQTNVVCESLNSMKFDFRYKNMFQNKKLLYQELIHTLSLICRRIPHGIIIICPNFRMIKDIKFYISSEGLAKDFQKRIIYEEKSGQKYIQLFKESAQDGAILICVCRGRASQGIDFPDHLCRAVIFLGIPFPNIKDPIIIQKRQHLQLLEKHKYQNPDLKNISWEQWYFNGTMRAINQGLGRVIRHVNDYGMLFLVDERYHQNRFIKALPSWIKGSIQIWKQMHPSKFQQIQEFYKRNSLEFKQDIQSFKQKRTLKFNQNQFNQFNKVIQNQKTTKQKMKSKIQIKQQWTNLFSNKLPKRRKK